jgi:hypothetical protein
LSEKAVSELAKRHPNIHRFTQNQGWIEIGLHEVLSNFVRAYDFGGTVYEGDSDYPSLETALDDLGAGIKAHLDYHKF